MTDYDHVKKGFLSDNAVGNAMHIISPQFGGIPFDEKYTKKMQRNLLRVVYHQILYLKASDCIEE